jgi:hypothetical protein
MKKTRKPAAFDSGEPTAVRNRASCNVVMSWSGRSSNHLARILKQWLADVVHSLKPWMSEEDIQKGSWWSRELPEVMRDADACIVCVTPDNLSSPWIHFEAGFIAHAIGRTLVCPYLLHTRKADVTGPMAQLQLTSADRDDTLRLVMDLNARLGDLGLTTERLQRSFNLHWPALESQLAALKIPSGGPQSVRPDSDILLEMLDRIRTIEASASSGSNQAVDVKSWLRARIQRLREAATQPDASGDNPEYPAMPTDAQRREWSGQAQFLEDELERLKRT